MQVIKEAFVIQNTEGTYMCAQNTLTPKLYASKRSAQTAVDYYMASDSFEEILSNTYVGYTIKKVFLVLGDDNGN
jgi:hypothetical protein